MKPTKPLGSYLKLNRVAASLDMSRRWVRERIRVGDFRGFKLGKSLVIEAASVEEYLKARALTQDAPKAVSSEDGEGL